MINTDLITTNNQQLDFIKLGTLEQFIDSNYQQMLQIYNDNAEYGMGTDFSIDVWFTSDGKLADPFNEDAETLGYVSLPWACYSEDGWKLSDIVTDLLTVCYRKCQTNINEQKMLNDRILKESLKTNTNMFTHKSYTDYVIANLDKMDANNISSYALAITENYSLKKILIKLNDYDIINPNLYSMLLKYCLYLLQINFHIDMVPYNNLDNSTVYINSLIKILQNNAFKEKFINQLLYSDLSPDYCVLLQLLNSTNNTIVLPLHALNTFDNQETMNDEYFIRNSKQHKMIFSMQNVADFDLFLRNINIADTHDLPINIFLKNEYVIVKLKGDKNSLIAELIKTLQQRGANADAIKLLINFLSN